MSNCPLEKAKKRDDSMLSTTGDVKRLWGVKPQQLINSNTKVLKKAFPSQIKEAWATKKQQAAIIRSLHAPVSDGSAYKGSNFLTNKDRQSLAKINPEELKGMSKTEDLQHKNVLQRFRGIEESWKVEDEVGIVG